MYTTKSYEVIYQKIVGIQYNIIVMPINIKKFLNNLRSEKTFNLTKKKKMSNRSYEVTSLENC